MVRAAPSGLNVSNTQRWLEFGSIQIDLDGIRAFCCGTAIDMGLREFHLLCFLVRNPNVTHSRATLIQAAWPADTSIRAATVDTYILRLRTALRRGCATGLIRTVRAKGYELDGIVPDLPSRKKLRS